MSKNPKFNIALAFVLTFLIGLGAGYMLHGLMQPPVSGYAIYPLQDLAAPLQDVPPDVTRQYDIPIAQQAPEHAAEPYDPEQERPIIEETAESGIAGRTGRQSRDNIGMRDQRPDVIEGRSAMRDEELATADEYRTNREDGRSARAVPDERPGRGLGYARGEGAGSGAGAGYRSIDERHNDEDYNGALSGRISRPDESPGYRNDSNGDPDLVGSGRDSRALSARPDTLRRDEGRRDWRSDGDRTHYNRIRLRLVRDLGLSEEEAEHFFTALDEHRRLVRDKVMAQQAAIRLEYQKLNEKLDEDISKILSDEQMQIWKDKYAPRMDISRRGRPDASDEDQE